MPDQTDYRDTVFLPKTDFPMKAGLANKEPAILARWAAMGLYEQLREDRDGREKFILHDGPPYANGNIHIGHSLNKILKDLVVRSQSLLGKDAPYVPGWDCHGLPIEWKIEEEYRKKKRNKDEVPAQEFRAECRAYADKWVDVQREEFQRLGIMGEWDNPYLTMDFAAEATIVEEFLKFATNGLLYRGAKPVMWSPVEKTALAEAEVEYADIVSTQIDVGFEIVDSPVKELIGAQAVVWTTTPWTIPVNQALAYGDEIDYVLLKDGDQSFLIAEQLAEAVASRTGQTFGSPAWRGKGSDLAGTITRHPMHHLGSFFGRPRPMLSGDFVTVEAGTGLVHMAPDHGEDDFALCKAHGMEPAFAVEDDGCYREDWGWLPRTGSVINKKFNAPDGPICEDLRNAGALLSASDDFAHSYPHSWRSKAKVVFRCTPQWFVALDKPMETAGNGATLRDVALSEIDKTRFVPERGHRRLRSMVEGRPDWVLSRQRAWGVPITLYVHKQSGEFLIDPDVYERIIDAVRLEGADAWFSANHQRLLGDRYKASDYDVITDILDVWFDSGSTHAFVLESDKWPHLTPPADLYLEGSDQHRGWFQSSLLESCGTRGHAPYKALLTHGMTLDAKGLKMSKSVGNTMDPQKIINVNGADILRLWAATVDFTEDHRIGPEIIKGVTDSYRKLRNSFRYMLGALGDFDDNERVAVDKMPELERYVLHLLAELDATLKQAVNDFAFSRYVRALTDFANEDLSAFFFDIRKDSLYCDAADDRKRRAYRTVLDSLYQALVRYAAPVLCFTAEEVWQTRYPDEKDSVHLQEWPDVSEAWADPALAAKWQNIRTAREQVTEAIEPFRRDKIIRSSLEAEVSMPELADADREAFAEICIVADVQFGADAIAVSKTAHSKCGRCWRHLPDVTEEGALCGRCTRVVDGQ
jgi:isoleucyl-tRNA synthetase